MSIHQWIKKFNHLIEFAERLKYYEATAKTGGIFKWNN